LGTALNIKPLLHIEHGKIEAKESVRTRKRALSRLQEIYREANDPERRCTSASSTPTPCPTRKPWRSAIQAIRVPDLQIITQISAVISVHTGPGAVGFAILQ
jgi:fatty acid-binding protein DegV